MSGGTKTADGTAAVRALHLLDAQPPFVFNDPYALRLTSAWWRTVVRIPTLRWLIIEKLLGPLRPVHGEMLARARFGEDALDRAVRDGIRQYVILGAGLDSFALRRRDFADRVTVFELDHPAAQKMKKIRLRRLGEEMPSNVEFVPIDFERQTVDEALRRTRFDYAREAFFSWFGVTYYLSSAAVFTTLRTIANMAAAGSEVVLDYSVPPNMLPPEEQEEFRFLQRFVTRRREPWLSSFEPRIFVSDVEALGYTVLADLSPQEQKRAYFLDRRDGLRGPGWSRFVHLRLRG